MKIKFKWGGNLIPKNSIGGLFLHAAKDEVFEIADRLVAKTAEKTASKTTKKMIDRVAIANADGTVFRLYERYSDGTTKVVGLLDVYVEDNFIKPIYVEKVNNESKEVSRYLYDSAMAFHNKPLKSGDELLTPVATLKTWDKYFDKYELSDSVGIREGKGDGKIMLLMQPSQKVTSITPWRGGTAIKLEPFSKGEIPALKETPTFIKDQKQIYKDFEDILAEENEWNELGLNLDKRGGKLNKFQEGGNISTTAIVPAYRHISEEDAVKFDKYLSEHSRQIKNGQLNEELQHDLQRKFNLDKFLLDLTIEDSINYELGKYLLNLIQLKSSICKEGGKLIPKAAGGLNIVKKFLSADELEALSSLALIEVGKSKALTPLSRLIIQKFRKSLEPKITLSEEELEAKKAKALLRKLNLENSIEDSMSAQEAIDIKNLVLDPLVLNSYKEGSAKTYVKPNEESMLLTENTALVTSGIVKNILKAASIYNDEKITKLSKIVTSAYLTDTPLPKEFVTDLGGILKMNYINKNGNISTKNINYSIPEIFDTKKEELLLCFNTIKDNKYNLKKNDIIRIKRNGGGNKTATDNVDIESAARGQFNDDTPRILEYFVNLLKLDPLNNVTYKEWKDFLDKGIIPERFKKQLYSTELLNDPVLDRYAKISLDYMQGLAVQKNYLEKLFGEPLGFASKFKGKEVKDAYVTSYGRTVPISYTSNLGSPLGTYFAVNVDENTMARTNIPAMSLTPLTSKKELAEELESLYKKKPKLFKNIMDAYLGKDIKKLNKLKEKYPEEYLQFKEFINKANDIHIRKNKATLVHHLHYLSSHIADGLVKSGFDPDKFLKDYSEYRKSLEYLADFLGLPAWAHTSSPHKIHGAGHELPTKDLGQILSDVRIGFSRDSESANTKIKVLQRVREKRALQYFYKDILSKINAEREKLPELIAKKIKSASREETINRRTNKLISEKENKILKMKLDAMLKLYKFKLNDNKFGDNEKLIQEIIEGINKAKNGTKLIKQ